MRLILFSFGLAGSLLLGPQHASAETLVLEPTSEWKLREYDDKCRVNRSFGEGDDRVTLWIYKGGPGRYFNITAIGRPFRNPYGARVKIGFTPGESISRGYIATTSSKGRPVISMFGVPAVSFQSGAADEPEAKAEEVASGLQLANADGLASAEEIAGRFDAIQSLDISGALVQKLSLKTGPLTDILPLLQTCIDRMPSKRAQYPRQEGSNFQGPRAVGEREWAPKISADYPSYLLRERKEGSVLVRVQISPEGRATFCEAVRFTGAPGFADAACRAMIRNSRFNPALDEKGQPVWGSYQLRVTYRLNK
ncbi:MAG: energy transducer TonB [Pseudomonadota bacterium]